MFSSFVADTGVGFVNDDEVWACSGELITTTVCLNVIEADHSVGISLKQALRRWQASFQAARAGGCDGNCVNVELLSEFANPLIDKMWRAQHCKAVRQPAIQPFAQDHPCFDGFADTHIIGNQQSSYGLFESHHQRNKLISPWLNP